MFPVSGAVMQVRPGLDETAYSPDHPYSDQTAGSQNEETLRAAAPWRRAQPDSSETGPEPASKVGVPAWLQRAGRGTLLTHEQEIALAQRMESAREQLNRKEEERIKERLVAANLRLVATVARRYAGHGLPLEDLMQEGTIGLMTAVERFDWRKGYRFSTYAIWWIRSAINRAIVDQAGLIRLPAHITDTLSRISKLQGILAQRLGRMPTEAEIAAEIGMSETDLSELLRDSVEPVSLDAPVDEQGSSRLADMIPDTDTQDPVAAVTRYSLQDAIQNALEELLPREKQVLHLRYGLDGNEPHTLEETSRALKLTRVMVYKIETLALKKLRRRDQIQHLMADDADGVSPSRGLVPVRN